MTILLAATAAIFVAILLVLIRLFAGPTPYDRVLAVNTFGTVTVLLLSILGFKIGRAHV